MTRREPSCKRSTGPTSPTDEDRPIRVAFATGAFGPTSFAPARVIRSAHIASARTARVRPPRQESYGAERDERTAMISQWCVAPRQFVRGAERAREAAAITH